VANANRLSLENYPEHFQRYAKSPDFRPMGAGRVLCGRSKDGSEIDLEISLGYLETDDGMLLIGTFRKLTQRQRQGE